MDKISQFRSLVGGATLSEREVFVLAKWLGVEGVPWPLQKIGEELGGLSRQRVSVILKTVRRVLGEEAIGKLDELFPRPPSYSEMAKQQAHERGLVRAWLKSHSAPVNYGEVHSALGIDPKRPNGEALGEIASCWALFEDYGIRATCRHKLCTRCEEFRPIDEFYEVGDGTRRYQLCKTCNSERCGDYVRNNREKTNKARAEWLRNNPDKARAIQQRYHNRKKQSAK